MIIWHNQAFKDDEPILSIHDRMRLGEGVFNTMLVVDGDIKHADTHFKKLLKNSEFFLGDWDKPDAQFLYETARELLHKNKYLKGRFAFNTIISCGPSGNGIRLPENTEPHIMMRALPLNIPNTPIHCAITTTVKRNEGSPLSQIKCCNYGDNILALREAKTKGANEAIMINNKNKVACASTANLLIIKDNKLFTPPLSDGCQNGITRSIAMDKFNVKEKSFSVEDLHKVEGIYLLNSLRGAVPVVTLDGKPLGTPPISIDPDFHIS